MRNPNGYGSICKLGGNRRKPYAVRLTTGWADDGKQLYEYLGYYKTRKEALVALAEYNQNPYDLRAAKLTFSEIYVLWSEERYPKLKKSNINGYSAAYKHCSAIYGVTFSDLRKLHLQRVIDKCDRSYPTLNKIKVLFSQLYRYALENDIVSKDYSKFVDIGSSKNNSTRKPFTDKEIKTLWSLTDDDYAQIALMLIYSGVRISELLKLKKEHIHLEERYFDILEAKTAAGIRKVPIARKVLPLFENWMHLHPETEQLLSLPSGKPLSYDYYVRNYWNQLMIESKFAHRPHDTRHTTISLLAKANVNQTIIKRIVGHAGAMSMTEKVYTHFDLESLLQAIDSI